MQKRIFTSEQWNTRKWERNPRIAW